MDILLLFAFLAGVVTIISPCVLPVLPILLSTSTGGGRSRPLGIVLGLAATFTAATLAVTAAAQALALPTVWLRTGAIVLLGVFGLTLLIPALGERVERLLAPLTRIGAGNPRQGGFGIGLIVGAGLGLLWAPCVGPIMASVIGLTATVGITAQAVAITLAYSLGAALPMLAIAYGGRGLAARTRKLSPRTNMVKQMFGALTVVACVALFLGADTALQTFTLRSLPPGYGTVLQSFENVQPVQDQLDRLGQTTGSTSAVAEPNAPAVVADTIAQPEATMTPLPTPKPTSVPTSIPASTPTPVPGLDLRDLGQAPELTGTTDWINSEPLTLASLRGKVVIIDFWTFECYNCVNTLPYVRDLYDKYHSQGLEIIGVHTPEFAVERVPANVQKATRDLGVTWPVVLDPEYKTWSAYNNGYWPAFYFIDAKGHIRYMHIGEGNYDYNEKVVQQLLSEAKAGSQ
jgi:cytochrome c biogenesis protein CcdA/thiol-disulfide isomerase/thioredoxin